MTNTTSLITQKKITQELNFLKAKYKKTFIDINRISSLEETLLNIEDHSFNSSNNTLPQTLTNINLEEYLYIYKNA